MRILAELDKSEEGNDCWIHKVYQLISFDGEHHILIFYKVNGWSPQELTVNSISVNNLNEDLEKIYEELKEKQND